MRALMEFFLYPPVYFNKSKLHKKIEGKTILITGASYGIGEATATLLATKGVHLILVARSEEKLTELKSKLEKNGAVVTLVVADLYKDTDVEMLCDYINRQDKIDIFINNAGKSIRRSVYDSLNRFHDFERTMKLNYSASVKLALCFIHKWKQNQGQIISVSAINVLLPPQPLWSGYQASKTAFDQWTRSIYPELKANGIYSSTLYLPLVKTRMIEPTVEYRNVPAMSPEYVAKLIGKKIISKRRKYTPWWFLPAKILFYFFNSFWLLINRNKWKRTDLH